VPERRVRPRPVRGTLLTVDIGNSDTVVGRFRGAALDGFWRVTSRPLTHDEAWLTLSMLLGPAARGDRPRGAVLCSVVPALTAPWAAALERATGRPALEIGPRGVAGLLEIRTADPGAVGADRLANAIGARELHGAPAIVVDLGTATTFDCVSADGAYLGGAIAPGVGTSAEELFRRAARVPRVDLRPPEHALGRTTDESLRSGVVWGAAGQVDALVRRLSREMAAAKAGRGSARRAGPRIVATGGWAKVIAPECETIDVVDEGLTLHGMRLVWEARS
jgi:type III pantothenate kinase